ncbi:hypothetical protein [Gemmatimonas sp.]
MSISLQDLGLSTDELIDRVVAAAAKQLLHHTVTTMDGDDDDEGSYQVATPLKKKLDAEIQERITAAVSALLAEHIEPLVTHKLDTLLLIPTNQWGEKKGEALTFVEYATARAEAYLTEAVNLDGKSRSENGGYSWSPSTTRVVYLANQHLKYAIEGAMKHALADANKHIAGGIEAAVRQSLAEVQQKLRVEVKV